VSRGVERVAVRITLLAWAALLVIGLAARQAGGRLTVRVAVVVAAGILVIEGARRLQQLWGPDPQPSRPLVRLAPRAVGRRPGRLQSWDDLFRVVEGDAPPGPLLRTRLAELSAGLAEGRPVAPMDAADPETAVAALEELAR
jgi:hypothetical protein